MMDQRFPRRLASSKILAGAIGLIALWACCPTRATAQTFTWNSTGVFSSWSTPGNWSPAGPPTNGSDVVFATAAASDTIPSNDLVGLSLNSLTLNNSNANTIWTIFGNAISVPTVNVTTAGYTLAMNAPLGTSGSPIAALTKSGSGNLNLTSSSFANSTTVSGGTLFVNGTTLTGSGAGAVTVQSGATLAGSGTVANAPVTVNSGGTVSPGSSGSTTGTLTLPATTFTSNGTYAVEIGSFAVLSSVDKITVNGALNLNTGSILAVTNISGPTPNDNDNVRSYTIGTATSINGSTSGTTVLGVRVVGGANSGAVTINPSGFAAGDIFTLERQGTILVLTYQPIPEPGAVLAVFLCGAGLFQWQRRKSSCAIGLS